MRALPAGWNTGKQGRLGQRKPARGSASPRGPDATKDRSWLLENAVCPIGPRKSTDAVGAPRLEQALEANDEVLASTGREMGWADKARAACAICGLIGEERGRARAARVVSLIEVVAGSAGSAQDTHSGANAARGCNVPMNVLIVMSSYVSSRVLTAGSARTGCLSSLMLLFSQIMR